MPRASTVHAVIAIGIARQEHASHDRPRFVWRHRAAREPYKGGSAAAWRNDDALPGACSPTPLRWTLPCCAPKKRDTKMSPLETGRRNPASAASFRTPRPALMCEMPPRGGISREVRSIRGGDGLAGWACRIRTGESVSTLSDRSSLAISPEIGATKAGETVRVRAAGFDFAALGKNRRSRARKADRA